jgi:hypothetical protein
MYINLNLTGNILSGGTTFTKADTYIVNPQKSAPGTYCFNPILRKSVTLVAKNTKRRNNFIILIGNVCEYFYYSNAKVVVNYGRKFMKNKSTKNNLFYYLN